MSVRFHTCVPGNASGVIFRRLSYETQFAEGVMLNEIGIRTRANPRYNRQTILESEQASSISTSNQQTRAAEW
jgi:hypothetical protein